MLFHSLFVTFFIEAFEYIIMATTLRDKKYCPVAIASMTLSSKWDLVIIHSLLSHSSRFSELKRKISGSFPGELTASSLTRVLRRLESSGLVVKESVKGSVYPMYGLSQKGKDLQPVLNELYKWGEKHIP